ncbi:DUF4259 domain-containing protein [Streptomyces sp. N2-109]|uniref:DUF4259 domain-containing protein n=1 Tax=Streptomyces gossypii TaxID=2883101 RepID=A0ABT2JYW3_9ACTN|nr:DUF4259 domain-containing protein [Streptomyces gossypii]
MGRDLGVSGLDEAAADEREGIIHDTLTRVIGTAGYLEAPESEEAVAAAALVAAQCRGGQPADPHHGPEEPIPDLTHLRAPTLQALDRIMTEPSELMHLWVESDGGPSRATINRLQNTLLPEPPREQLR